MHTYLPPLKQLTLIATSLFVIFALAAPHTTLAADDAAQENNTAPTHDIATIYNETANAHNDTANDTDAQLATENNEHEAHDDAHANVNPLWIIPFAVLLGFIALAPLINAHWWEHHYPKVAAVLFLIGFGYYFILRSNFSFLAPGMHHWIDEMKEYVSFIALLFALFVVSGGIVIHVSRKATPMANCTLLLLGAIIANIFGTTGAAMLLIRPYIRINKAHIKPYHIIFFIFIVANVGGCLTPVGDPPLFLGYLQGVPFFWVLEHCWQPWLMGVLILLLLFFFIDKIDHKKTERYIDPEHDSGPAVRINGIHNFLFIIIVLIAVFQPSIFEIYDAAKRDGFTINIIIRFILNREVIMVIAALTSKIVTKKGIYEWNEFSWEPIREVAILFVAIFSTMVPALEWLGSNAEKMPIKKPSHYFFVTGTLSSVLDNAPTYLTFLQTKSGEVEANHKADIDKIEAILTNYKNTGNVNISGQDKDVANTFDTLHKFHDKKIKTLEGEKLRKLIRVNYIASQTQKTDTKTPPLALYLIAISVGAVFFGACTYIGNAPNFMVKSIAESSGIRMPSFLGYVFKYSFPILVPVYILIWLVFFF